MESLQSRFIKLIFRSQVKKMERLNFQVWDENTSVIAFREYCEKSAAKAKLPSGVESVPVTIPGLPEGLVAEWLQPTSANKIPQIEDAVIFYIHGGGYISGSCSDHRAMVAKLVARSGIRLLLYEYRLAPEHPFPAALEDTILTYRWLLTQIHPETRIIIAGDSAGGGLCLATLLVLRDFVLKGKSSLQGLNILLGQAKLQLPIAGVAISPSTDMALTGKPNPVKGSIEPEGMAFYCSKYYSGNYDPHHPYISPLYGDLTGLPPLLLVAGGEEGGLDDAVRFADKAKEAVDDVRLIIGKGQLHCYPLLPDFIPESKEAMAEICTFMHQHLIIGNTARRSYGS